MRLTASGSFKRTQDAPPAARATEPSLSAQPLVSESSQGHNPGDKEQHAEEPGSPSPQSKAAGVGRARVVAGRGRRGAMVRGRGRGL